MLDRCWYGGPIGQTADIWLTTPDVSRPGVQLHSRKPSAVQTSVAWRMNNAQSVKLQGATSPGGNLGEGTRQDLNWQRSCAPRV